MGRLAKTEEDKKVTVPTSMRITPLADAIWEQLSKDLGVNKMGILELSLRYYAREQGLDVSKLTVASRDAGQEAPQ